jgi:hypothetical protein
MRKSSEKGELYTGRAIPLPFQNIDSLNMFLLCDLYELYNFVWHEDPA